MEKEWALTGMVEEEVTESEKQAQLRNPALRSHSNGTGQYS